MVHCIVLAPLSVGLICNMYRMGRKFTFYFHKWLLLAAPSEHQNLSIHVLISANAVIACKIHEIQPHECNSEYGSLMLPDGQLINPTSHEMAWGLATALG